MAIPILTPAGPLAKRGKTLTHFIADQNVTWSTDGGVLSGILAAAVDWTAPNQSGNWHLNGQNIGLETGIALINVEAILPNYWEFQNPLEAIKKKLEFEPIAGPTQHRTFGGSAPQHRWELRSDDSSLEERNEMKAFWDWHDPGKQFLMWDPVINETRRYETDSNWSELYKVGDGFSWKFRIKEIWPYAIIP